MRFLLAIFCMLASGDSALAQYGVSSTRDAFGNLVRNAGETPQGGINRGPINNGPTNNGPAQSPMTNSRMNRGTSR